MDFQIVGGNGMVFSPEDSEAMVLISGYDRGTLTPDIFVGAASGSIAARLSPQVAAQLNSRLQQARQLRPISASGPQIVPASPGPIREVVQGLSTGSIAAGAQADIVFNATMAFRPSRLMVGTSSAPLFSIIDLKVGADSLFMASGAVPAEVFVPGGVGSSALKRRTAAAGTPITVSVRNDDGAAHSFKGALFGEGADTNQCA